MKEITIRAYAKINLTLDVLGLRADGYHEVKMLMQTINLYDELQLQSAKADEFTCSHSHLPMNQDNLVVKAVRLLREEFGIAEGVNIHLQKNIPMAAGLAGGSTDAAATLLALNQLWRLNLPIGRLLELSKSLGSDIPFCLIGGTAMAYGRGEKLNLMPSLKESWLVLVKPSFGVSTPTIYRQWDERQIPKKHVFTEEIVHAIGKETLSLEGLSGYLGNDLEAIVLPLYPEIQEIKAELQTLGALNVLMSGSGPTVYGIMTDRESAFQIKEKLRRKNREVFVTSTI
jgi:4-diphosphocytidyl-2-C-methyl-D-erythritol kinase